MTIGILTFHLAHNYGAVLQCYALQEVLSKMGHQVYVINYQQPYIIDQFKPKRLFGIRSFLKTLVKGNVKDYFYKSALPYIKDYKFKKFRNRFFRLTAACYTSKEIPDKDLYIIGSDQPWNPDLTGGPDLVYWGQFEKMERSKIVTYAMSGSIEAIGKVGWDNIRHYCKKFDYLSFRETVLADRFTSLLEKRCFNSLDPTLLTTAQIWVPMLNYKWQKRKYVLLYHVGGPNEIIDSMTLKAKEIAEQESLELIDASKYLYSPSDFISLIKYAQYIVTASFHAMVFSIVFHKAFVVVKTGQASDIRFNNLLSILEIEKTNLKDIDDISIPVKPDYEKIDKRLEVMRKSSMDYLKLITSDKKTYTATNTNLVED